MHRVTWLALACALIASGQSGSPVGVPAEVKVTVGHYYGPERRVLTRDDFVVTQNYDPLPITKVVPLRGAQANLDLFLLVDNCSNCDPSSKFEELRRFILSQPATTAVGVAYIQNGQLRIGQVPSPDHERAVNALSTPAGNPPSDPFAALTELIESWGNPSRHAVLMISNGINPAAPGETQDPSAEAAIAAAQRAGVAVFSIYHPSADYVKGDLSSLYGGQVQLAHVATETGGEAYFLGFGPLPSLAPFLNDITEHLANQYSIEFLANPSDGAGALQEITVKTKIDVELMVPDKAWIPGAQADSPSATDRSRGKRP